MGRLSEFKYEIIDINESAIDEYDLFCDRTKKKREGYNKKKNWVRSRFKHGLQYKILLIEEKGKLRYKGFIEYIPGEYCWREINAPNYMVIHCLWVKGLLGKYKGSGFDFLLAELSIWDAQRLQMNGVAVVTDKTTWLPNSKLFKAIGFEKADSYVPSFDLYVMRFKESAPYPKFNREFENQWKSYPEGLTIFESDQCPPAIDMNKGIERYAEWNNIPVQKIRIEDCQVAQKEIHPCGSMCFLLQGEGIVALSREGALATKGTKYEITNS